MLRVTLHVNKELIGDYEVRNVTQPERLTAEGMSVYEVREIDEGWLRDSEPMFRLEHKRIDGAEVLAAKALRKIAQMQEAF